MVPVARSYPLSIWYCTLVVAVGLLANTARAQRPAGDASAAAAGNGGRALFNGRDLSGFTTWLVDSQREDPRHVFRVTDGQIHITGDGLGYLATCEEYSNYRLLAEFRWGMVNTHWNDRVGRARDSGIFLHATGPDGNSHDGNGAFMAAIECNLFQAATGDFLLIRGSDSEGRLIAPRVTAEVAPQRDADGWYYWQPGGERRTIETWGRLNWFDKCRDWRDVLDYRGPRDREALYGQWNRIECLCQADRITITLNGTVVNEVSQIFPQRGRILLQCEGSEIFFRRLELFSLKPERDRD